MDKRIEAVSPIEVNGDELIINQPLMKQDKVYRLKYLGIAMVAIRTGDKVDLYEECHLFESKPDKGRLLDPYFEIGKMVRQQFSDPLTREVVVALCVKISETQDIQTARIKDQECQEKLQRIKDWVDKEVFGGGGEDTPLWKLYPNERWKLHEKWQALKKKEEGL